MIDSKPHAPFKALRTAASTGANARRISQLFQTHRTVRDTNPIIDLSAEKEKGMVMDEVIVAHAPSSAHLLAAACETWRSSTFSFPLRRSRERELREDLWHVRSSPACVSCCPRFSLSCATMRRA